jgi:signal transduction histidine kinase
MGTLNLQIITLVIAGVANLMYAIVLYFRSKSKRSDALFTMLAVCISAWIFARVVFELITTSADSYIWAEILYFTASLIPLVFVLYAYSFHEDKLTVPQGMIAALFLPFLINAVIIFIPGVLIKTVAYTPLEGHIIEFGRGYYFYVVFIIAYFAWGSMLLFDKYQVSTPQVKLQLSYLFWATVITLIVSVTTNLILPAFGFFRLFWLGPILTVVMTMFSFHALQLKTIINRQIIISEICTILILMLLLSQTIFIHSSASPMVRMVQFVLMCIFGFLIIRSSSNEVQSGIEMQRLADNLQKTNKRLWQLNLAKSDFLSIASHQLKTPLSIIKGYVDMALDNDFGKITHEQRVNLKKVYISNERLIGLVEDLLSLSRIEDGKMTYDKSDEDLVEITHSVVDEFQDQADKKKLHMIWERPPKIVMVYVDKNKVRNVIFNMVDNALKYTMEGSVTVRLAVKGKEAIVSVADTGIGISKEHLKKLFEKFVRVGDKQSEVSGFGLGLYIARMIMKDNAGEIWAESKGPGKGSTFSIKLPLKSTTKKLQAPAKMLE